MRGYHACAGLQFACVSISVLSAVPAAAADEADPALVEPYPLLTGDAHGAPAAPLSPDPLVSMTWPTDANITGLQRYEVNQPVAWQAFPSVLRLVRVQRDDAAVAGAGWSAWGVGAAACAHGDCMSVCVLCGVCRVWANSSP